MEDPILALEFVEKKDSKEPMLEKQQELYNEIKNMFEEMVDDVIELQNKDEFEQVAQFISERQKSCLKSRTLPACLLLNKSDYANAGNQIDKLHEYLVGKGHDVVKLDGCIFKTIYQCMNYLNGELKKAGSRSSSTVPTGKRKYAQPKSKTLTGKRKKEGVVKKEDDNHESTASLSLIYEYLLKKPFTVLIDNILSMKSNLLNDLLHSLISDISRGSPFNVIIGIGRSLDVFHSQVDLALVPLLSVKIVSLPSTRDSILSIIGKYILDKRFRIQPSQAYVSWLYQQVLMHNLSLKSFIKTFQYMIHSMIFENPLFFLTRHFEPSIGETEEDTHERKREYFSELKGLLSKQDCLKIRREGIMTEITESGLEDLYDTFNIERENFLNIFDLISHIVFSVYCPGNKSISRAKLLLNLIATDVVEKKSTLMKYFRNVGDFLKLIYEVVIPYLRDHLVYFQTQLSNLEGFGVRLFESASDSKELLLNSE